MNVLALLGPLLLAVTLEWPKPTRPAASPFDSRTAFPALQRAKPVKEPAPASPVLVPVVAILLEIGYELLKEHGPELKKELESWIRPSTRTGPATDASRAPYGHLAADRDKVGEWEVFRVFKHEDKTFSFAAHTGFLTAEGGGGQTATANRPQIGEWEKWTVIDLQDGTFGLRTRSGKYLCVDDRGRVTADRKALDAWETFTLVHDETKKTCSFRCWNGKYLSAQP